MAAIEPSSSPSWASWEKRRGAGKEANQQLFYIDIITIMIS